MGKKVGFTLVEMIVTLMIIITLSLLSFPLYEGRSHKTSMLAEGYALLGTIIEAQVSYYNEYGYFLAPESSLFSGRSDFIKTWYDPILGINAMNNRYFTVFNAYGLENIYVGDLPNNKDPYKYHFIAKVMSAQAGTISLEYNRTQRYEPVVSGV